MSVLFPPYTGGGGGGGVASVNGDAGPDVVLDAADLNAVERSGLSSRVYATTGSGVETTLVYGTPASANALVQRHTGGAIITATPTQTSHATTKAYVDAIQTALDARLDALEAGAVMSDGTVTDLVSKTETQMAGITPDPTTVYAVVAG